MSEIDSVTIDPFEHGVVYRFGEDASRVDVTIMPYDADGTKPKTQLTENTVKVGKEEIKVTALEDVDHRTQVAHALSYANGELFSRSVSVDNIARFSLLYGAAATLVGVSAYVLKNTEVGNKDLVKDTYNFFKVGATVLYVHGIGSVLAMTPYRRRYRNGAIHVQEALKEHLEDNQ
jgi:hypothetical protein